MKTIDAARVTARDLETMEAAAAELPEDSEFRGAVEHMSASVREGQDVVVAPENDLASPSLVAKILGVSRTHLYKILDSGDLPFVCVGRDRRISFADVRVYLSNQDQVRQQAAERFAHPASTRRAALDAYKRKQ